MTIHGAPRNSGRCDRWSYICAYFADDVLYTGMSSPRFDGLGLTVGQRLEHPRFPLLENLTAPLSGLATCVDEGASG
jgi:hypothetical protein